MAQKGDWNIHGQNPLWEQMKCLLGRFPCSIPISKKDSLHLKCLKCPKTIRSLGIKTEPSGRRQGNWGGPHWLSTNELEGIPNNHTKIRRKKKASEFEKDIPF